MRRLTQTNTTLPGIRDIVSDVVSDIVCDLLSPVMSDVVGPFHQRSTMALTDRSTTRFSCVENILVSCPSSSKY